jgi:GntR family transcriptional regulator/MocR family aminotransferase
MGPGGDRDKGHFAMKRARLIDLPLPADLDRLGRPLWRGLESAIAWQIDIGRVPAGSRVPSTRTIARRLGLSRTTVAIAFDALVADGYLAPRIGDGTYVLDQAHRSRLPFWERPRRWIRDPDGLLVWVTT